MTLKSEVHQIFGDCVLTVFTRNERKKLVSHRKNNTVGSINRVLVTSALHNFHIFRVDLLNHCGLGQIFYQVFSELCLSIAGNFGIAQALIVTHGKKLTKLRKIISDKLLTYRRDKP